MNIADLHALSFVFHSFETVFREIYLHPNFVIEWYFCTSSIFNVLLFESIIRFEPWEVQMSLVLREPERTGKIFVHKCLNFLELTFDSTGKIICYLVWRRKGTSIHQSCKQVQKRFRPSSRSVTRFTNWWGVPTYFW